MAPFIVVILVLHSILYEKLSQIYNDSDNAHSFFPNYGERRKLDVHVAFIIFAILTGKVKENITTGHGAYRQSSPVFQLSLVRGS